MTALRFGMFALGLAACLTPSAVRAIDLGLEPYVQYDIGVTFMRNQNLTRANPPAGGLSGHVESEPGFNVGAAVGTAFLEHFRAEISGGYHQNQVENIAIRNEDSSGKGHLSLAHLLANVYAEYDLELGVIPYFGLGAGWGMVILNAENQANTFQADSEDHAFLWNVMGGVSYPFSDVTTFSFGYRYLMTEDLNFGATISGIGDRQVDSEYDAHELVVGLRYHF